MRFLERLALTSIVFAVTASPALGQHSASDYRDEVMTHFERSTGKIVALANAMPEHLYTWRPGDGVMSVAQVYMHIARYNYLYPETSLGVPAPAGIDMANLEAITEKERVTALLAQSVEHVRKLVHKMGEKNLTNATILYGREVPEWAVLLQLVAHMNEHVGQSVAYARMNGIVPPWSR